MRAGMIAIAFIGLLPPPSEGPLDLRFFQDTQLDAKFGQRAALRKKTASIE